MSKKIEFFKNIKNEAQLSKMYRRLAKELHPDTAKDETERIQKQADFQKMSEEYTKLKTAFEYQKYITQDENQPASEPKEARADLRKARRAKANALRAAIASQYTSKERKEIKENATIFIQSLVSPMLDKFLRK